MVSPFNNVHYSGQQILFLMPRRLSCYSVTGYMGRFLGADQLTFGQLGSKGFATEKSHLKSQLASPLVLFYCRTV